MRRTYSVIAWIIAAGVVVQASSIAFGVAGMVVYVQDGGVVDKALVEARQQAFVGELGFMVHAIVGGGVEGPNAVLRFARAIEDAES